MHWHTSFLLERVAAFIIIADLYVHEKIILTPRKIKIHGIFRGFFAFYDVLQPCLFDAAEQIAEVGGAV